MAECQIISFSDEAFRQLTRFERLQLKAIKYSHWFLVRAKKIFSPGAVLRKLRGQPAARTVPLTVLPDRVIQKSVLAAEPAAATPTAQPADQPWRVPLKLQPGERVRVKTLEEIGRTLDEFERYEGCTFTSAMVPYCGREFVVLNRIERFFDERTATLKKAKNMVILETVHCQTPVESLSKYAGCDRRCYLFWKEAWLQRL